MIQKLKNEIKKIANELLDGGDFIVAEPTEQNIKSDLYTNIAFICAKRAHRSPISIAQELRSEIEAIDIVEKAEVAKNGFINIWVSNQLWIDQLKLILKLKNSYGHKQNNRKKVLIEHLSANPTGYLNIGHARSCVIGSIISNIFYRAGYEVTQEYYVNDCGKQIESLGKSIIAEIENDNSIQEYSGESTRYLAEKLRTTYSKNKTPRDIGNKAVSILLDIIKFDLSSIGVNYDKFTFESDIVKYVKDAIGILKDKGLVYEGTLPRPRSINEEDDWHSNSVLIFKSTQFGDDTDRALTDSNGNYTYFANDLGYHYYKIKKCKPDIMVNVIGMDHVGYYKRLTSAVNAMDSDVELRIICNNLVNLIVDGESKRMSKRRGIFSLLMDNVKLCGKDPIRINMISANVASNIAFDPDNAAKADYNNPSFYIKYAYVRCCSAMRNFKAVFNCDAINYNDMDYSIIRNSELTLIKAITKWMRIIDNVQSTLEPTYLFKYAMDVSRCIHRLWNDVDKDTDKLVINHDYSTSVTRCGVINAAQYVLKDICDTIGIDTPEKL